MVCWLLSSSEGVSSERNLRSTTSHVLRRHLGSTRTSSPGRRTTRPSWSHASHTRLHVDGSDWRQLHAAVQRWCMKIAPRLRACRAVLVSKLRGRRTGPAVNAWIFRCSLMSIPIMAGRVPYPTVVGSSRGRRIVRPVRSVRADVVAVRWRGRNSPSLRHQSIAEVARG